MSRRYRVALAGYYGFGNLGDELLLRASLEALDRCGVRRDRVVVLSSAPKETSCVLGADSVDRWSFSAVRGALRSSDTLLLGGGGLFQDSTSLHSCLWYWGLVRLARLCGARPWALGQSIGPLKRRTARWLTRTALSSCAVLQLRDGPSMEWARRLGVPAMPGADLALTLEMPRDAAPVERGRLLVNLRPVAGPERFVELAASCVDAFDGERVGVAMSPEDYELLEGTRRTGRLRIERTVLVKSAPDVASLWSPATGAVGMRLHFAVLSAIYGTPLALLSYDPKTAAFAEWVGLPGGGSPAEGALKLVRPRLPITPERVREDVAALCRAALSEA